MKGAGNFDEHILERLKTNARFREAYLNQALNETERGVALLMFRTVAEALGGVTRLSKATGLNRQNLYKVLSGKKDPAYSTVEGIVHGFGFRMKVEAAGRRQKERSAIYS